MGMPNIPTKILSEINIDRDEVMQIFCEAINTNMESVSKMFDKERDIMRLLKQSCKNLDAKQIKKIINSTNEINEILTKKSEVANETLKCIKKMYKGSFLDNNSLLYIFFFILVIGLSSLKINQCSNFYKT